MMEKGLLAAALIVVVVPVAYAASPMTSAPPKSASGAEGPSESGARACKTERSAMGLEAFAKKYGTNHNLRNAFGKCVSGKSRGREKTEKDEQDDDEKSEGAQGEGSSRAAAQCRKERTATGADAFARKYGTNHNRANALGKCVSTASKKEKGASD